MLLRHPGSLVGVLAGHFLRRGNAARVEIQPRMNPILLNPLLVLLELLITYEGNKKKNGKLKVDRSIAPLLPCAGRMPNVGR